MYGLCIRHGPEYATYQTNIIKKEEKETKLWDMSRWHVESLLGTWPRSLLYPNLYNITFLKDPDKWYIPCCHRISADVFIPFELLPLNKIYYNFSVHSRLDMWNIKIILSFLYGYLILHIKTFLDFILISCGKVNIEPAQRCKLISWGNRTFIWNSILNYSQPTLYFINKLIESQLTIPIKPSYIDVHKHCFWFPH